MMNNSALAIFAAAFLIVGAASTNFESWKETYGKTYPSSEAEARARKIFQDNLKLIAILNKNAHGANYSASKYADITPAEFRKAFLMPKGHLPEGGNAKNAASDRVLAPITPVSPLPESFDWRDKNAVTPVKNQGQCGSCWAFSTAETIESQWFLAGNKLVGLSEQQIVDCDNSDDGCGGGNPPTAYDYVINAGGLETESEYPYVAENTACVSKQNEYVAHIKTWNYVTQEADETQMLNALYNKGPLSVCVDASTWQFYSGGVIAYGDGCWYSLDHCVQITGYGKKDGFNVWIVRNSWGTDWGVDGYLYIERGHDICGIGDEVTLPVV